ncbi:MAG TPA: hypothetical protein VK465_07710, partial [Fibrobacteria bacterium]|nr:hypothetical protein [Fibrobacteria bacterium]
EYSVKDKGMGECAGEVVSLTEFGLKAADREVFEAQLKLDAGEFQAAADKAYKAMLHAAQGLVKYFNIDVSDDPQKVHAEFLERFHETKLFHDPFGGPRFVHYYIHAHDERHGAFDKDKASVRLQENQLFIEASHSCYLRMLMDKKPKSGLGGLLAAAEAKED